MKKYLFLPLLVAIYASLLTISEIAYRATFHFPQLEKISGTWAIFALFLALFATAKWRWVRYAIGGFVAMSFLANNLHYAIYRSWITGMNYYLMFAEIGEVWAASSSMLPNLWGHAIWAMCEIILFCSIVFFYRKPSRRAISDGIFIASMLLMMVRSFSTTHTQAVSPDNGYGRFKVNYFSFNYFIGRILPNEWLQLSKVPIYEAAEPPIISQPKIRNIVILMGESESAAHIQHFGYARETTPFFTELAQQYPNTVIKPIYSAGKLTGVSLPMLFNMVPRPNGLKHINKGTSNLFRLAQKQGFQTAFHSAQPESEMELINFIGAQWIDHLSYPTELGYGIKSGMNDHLLLPYLQKINLNQRQNFVVLHQRGSHIPYGQYLTEQEKFFKNNTPLDNYDSTIRHTNLLIKKIFQHLQQQPDADWLFIYTSDHGQYVTDSVFNQGTNEQAQYTVPLMIYSPNPAIQQQAQAVFASCGHRFHHQVSHFIAYAMGYEAELPQQCVAGVVSNNALSGDVGWLEIDATNRITENMPK